MLEVKDISKNYKQKVVLDNISFQLEEGEILGISGKSGIGKSTLGKIISGLELPDKGTVIYNSKEIITPKGSLYNDKSIRRDIQFIFQNPYTSLDNKVKIKKILLATLKANFPEDENKMMERIKLLLKKCRLEENILEKYPAELSGGQRQRVLIIRSILLNPKVIICDEITASLDTAIQNEILNLLLDLKKEYKLSYLFITHNQKILKEFCDRVIELK